jgi:hypothetical protein
MAAPSLLPDLETLYRELPWDASVKGESREFALRTATLWHGRDYLVLRSSDRPPTHSASDGVIAALTVLNASLVESILFGFLTFGVRHLSPDDGLRNLISRANALGALHQNTYRSLERLRARRNASVHPSNERVPRIHSKPTTTDALLRLTFHRLPSRTSGDLRDWLAANRHLRP